MKDTARVREIAERVRCDANRADEGAVAAWLLAALDEIDALTLEVEATKAAARVAASAGGATAACAVLAFAEERAVYVARIRALEAELKAMREASCAASA